MIGGALTWRKALLVLSGADPYNGARLWGWEDVMGEVEDMVLVDPRYSSMGGTALNIMGAAQMLGGAWILLLSDEQSIAARLILALLSLVSGALFLLVGRLVHEPKGGLIWEAGPRRFRLGGAREKDTLVVDASAVRGVAVATRTERWGREETAVEVASVELVLSSGATVLVAEPGDEDLARKIAGGLREITGFPEVDAPNAVTPLKDEVRVRLGSGSPLAPSLVTAGVLSLGVGAVMMANVKAAPVFGFLFGPAIGAIGLVLLALVVGKAFATEVIRLVPAGWRHEVHLGGRRFFERDLVPSDPEDAPGRVRLVTRGAQGFCLHLIRGGSIMVALNGVSRSTRLTPDGLLALAGDLAGGAGRTGEGP